MSSLNFLLIQIVKNINYVEMSAGIGSSSLQPSDGQAVISNEWMDGYLKLWLMIFENCIVSKMILTELRFTIQP